MHTYYSLEYSLLDTWEEMSPLVHGWDESYPPPMITFEVKHANISWQVLRAASPAHDIRTSAKGEELYYGIRLSPFMKRLISAVVVLILLLSTSCAVDLNNLQNYVDLYNNKIEDAPIVLRGMLGSENVDFTILLNNSSTLRWGMKMENAKIVRSAYGGLENPTIEAYTTESAINKVLDAEDPVAAYQEAEKSGLMRIEGKTIGAKMKIAVSLRQGTAA